MPVVVPASTTFCTGPLCVLNLQSPQSSQLPIASVQKFVDKSELTHFLFACTLHAAAPFPVREFWLQATAWTIISWVQAWDLPTPTDRRQFTIYRWGFKNRNQSAEVFEAFRASSISRFDGRSCIIITISGSNQMVLQTTSVDSMMAMIRSPSVGSSYPATN